MATILIVEDSQFQRKFLRGILEGFGREVLEAVKGSEGVAKAARLSPNVILLDLMMPHFTGMQMLEWIKERELPVPVVIVSADIQNTTRAKGMAPGAAAFVNKPADPMELEETPTTFLTPPEFDLE